MNKTKRRPKPTAAALQEAIEREGSVKNAAAAMQIPLSTLFLWARQYNLTRRKLTTRKKPESLPQRQARLRQKMRPFMTQARREAASAFWGLLEQGGRDADVINLMREFRKSWEG